ncbi:MAG: hypothetical protein QFX40_07810 [Archaeoglobales archaeon]|nr:hypothetical protein [Archaeoglobales archaeon]
MLPNFIFQAKENLVEKPWGGEWIALLKGFKGRFAESWEFSAQTSNPSEVIVGGKTISMVELFSRAKEEILGNLASKYSKFPLLVKIIDVSGRMDVMVNPSDRVAEMLGEKDSGKFAGWICLSDGKVYAGLKRDVSLEELERIVGDKKDSFLEILNEYSATPFATFLISPGLIYCAENLRFIEISTNSNLSYTLLDFSRKGSQVEKALKAVNLKKSEDFEIKSEKGRISTESFCAEVVEVFGSKEFEISTFNILVAIEGFSILKSSKETAELHKGYSCLIPASAQRYSVISEKATILRIYPR